MDAKAQSAKRPRVDPWMFGIALPALYLMFRFTAAAAFLAATILYVLYPLHRSARTVHIAFVLFWLAISIPVDVYVPGFHGHIIDAKASGVRFIKVIYGLHAHPTDGSEAISGGCVVGIHDTRWTLVWSEP